MTKDLYFEMCEAMGSEPIESEIPIDINDFPTEVQTCFDIYWILKDNWDPMGGNYLGKDYSILFELFRVYSITDPMDQLFSLSTIQQIDNCKRKVINEKIKNRSPQV